MKRLSKEQILMLHSQLIEQTGGTAGVRDFNLLESAIETPFQVFGGEELISNDPSKRYTSGLWFNKESLYVGWKQANRNTCDACVLCLKWNRITIYAKRIV